MDHALRVAAGSFSWSEVQAESAAVVVIIQ
jgi:hypothetical protein